MLNKKCSYLVILIATYNRLSLLKKSINSVIKGTGVPFEIIIIDGGSTDGTIEYLRKRRQTKGDITPVFQGKLIGSARCYNRVWKKIRCKYTIWLSDDTIITPGSLDLACKILEENTDIGMVGLKMKDTVGPLSKSPYLGGLSCYGILNCNHGVLPYRILSAVGFFNENYRSYHIDPDLTASVLSLGKKVVLTKKISVLHHRGYFKKESTPDAVMRASGGRDNDKIYREKFHFLQNAYIKKHTYPVIMLNQLLKFIFYKTNKESRIFGTIRRDLHNLINSTFIDPMDLFVNFNKPYYLVQSISKKVLKQKTNPIPKKIFKKFV